MPFDHVITDRAGLRSIYPEPHPVVVDKGIDHVDDTAADFIARSPFVALGTFGPGGGDVSPRGGPPGFVRVLDPERIALGDLVGNRRLDSYTNVIADGRVGLLFLVPGLGETPASTGRRRHLQGPRGDRGRHRRADRGRARGRLRRRPLAPRSVAPGRSLDRGDL